ncbi:MAG: homocysteine S-methyltransferase family protein [Victivallaceae bacterium]|nr:homocysteine S-methyltransferase family protein [Victivallaceae bacterium]
MTRSDFAKLAASRLLRLDGATGTELVKRGMPPGVSPELWCLEHPEAVKAVQRAYSAAGSDIVYVPTFGGNPVKLAEFGLESRTAEINRGLAELSRAALPDKLIFGDLAPTGQFIEPCGPLGFDEAVSIYKQQASALLAGGVDGFAIETMMDLQEARAALIAVRELSAGIAVIVTLTVDASGRTLTGVDPVSALVTLQALGADAFGCNCSTGPDEMAPVIARLKPYAHIPLAAKPNGGMPRLVDGVTLFDLGPEEFACAARKLYAAGASILGGCCGTTPEHIAALDRELGNLPPPGVGGTMRGVIASSSRFVRFAAGEPFAVIGERINPTGKKAFQAELRDGKLAIALDFASQQAEQGAAALDVNVGLAGIDEAAVMRRLTGELVRVSPLPLCIDSTLPEAVERALRLYPGRALLNSISFERDRLERTLPLAARYGAMPILLPLAGAGLPDGCAGRVAVLDKLLDEVAKFGYEPEDVLADALVMTVSADPAAALGALEFIEHCARRGIVTTGGLSNVSFGLPERAAANLAFLGMAIGRGLNSAIANPGAPGIVDLAAASDALNCRDGRLERYLARFGGRKNAPVPEAESTGLAPADALRDAVLAGRRDLVPAALERALASGIEPGDAVNNILIPAITEVGRRFEVKEYFLPQLMQSAEAMRSGMTLLEPKLAASGNAVADGPVFVLATVEGDIHDIGKNIVALLLKNSGFRVIDLGKDVAAATIVETARKERAAFIGLSALMTTTMPRMREVIALLRENGLNVPVLAGGAAVDKIFADSIGAVYCSDAMDTVRTAQRLFGQTK